MPTDQTSDMASPKGGDLVRRHRLSTRIWHWTNAATLLILLMSGLMIFNAHPRLYWGDFGANPDAAWLQIGAADDQGYLRIGSLQIQTTGWLGRWEDPSGTTRNRAFPYWMTIPSGYSLAVARLWHLTFAWLLAGAIMLYALISLVNGHFVRDLLPRLRELRPSHIWQDIKHHATLNFPKGAAALKYNILQKAAYLSVLVILIPGMILSGMTMSPQMTATWPWLLDLFGGRQSARSIHFIFAAALVGFFIIHMIMVLLAGPFNEVRSMITGWFRLPKEKSASGNLAEENLK